MTWRLTQDGTIDQTDAVRRGDGFTVPELTLERNVRGRLTFDLESPTRPAAYSTWQLDGRTGAPRFAGYLTRRTPIAHPAGAPRCYRCEVTDWSIVGDWFFWTKTYDTDRTLAAVLADLVADKLHLYGVTLAPGQVAGPTLAAGTGWTSRRGSDVLRDLVDQTGYMYEISPARVLRMFQPGTDAGPVALSEATNIADLTWEDADEIPHTTDVICWFGPATAGERLQTITADGVARAWIMDVAAVPGASTRGYVTVDGINKTIGDGAMYQFDSATSTLSVGTDPTPAAGVLIEFFYNAQYPYALRRSTGGSPPVELEVNFPTIIDYAQASAIADQQLAVMTQAVRVFRTTTLEDGFSPGQATSQDAPSRDAASVTVILTRVSARLETDLLWEWLLEGEETATLQPDYQTDWRRLVGASTSGAPVLGVAGGGGTGGGGGMIPLPPASIYVGSAASVAEARPMSGDVAIAIGGATTVVHVPNTATTGTAANVPNTLVLRDASGDFASHTATLAGVVSPASTDLNVQSGTGADVHVGGGVGRYVYLDPPDSLILSPAGYVLVDPGAQAMLAGKGYYTDLGQLWRKYRTIHAAELWVETLVAQNTLATIGGRIIVAPTNTLTRDLAASDVTPGTPYGTCQIFTKYNAFKLHVPGVELGSKLIMESGGRFEAFVVLNQTVPAQNAEGDYTYTVYRDVDGSGANDWIAGDALVDTGKQGDGFIDLYSLSGLHAGTQIGPSIVGNLRTGPNYNDWAPRWAIGNLDGLYGYLGTVFGAAFGDNAKAWWSVDPVNGVRQSYGSTVVSQLDMSGNAFFTGKVTAGSGAIGGWNILPTYLYAPLTNTSMAFNSAVPSIEIGDPRPTGWADSKAGIWMGKDADGAYKFRASSASGAAGFFWDGAVATFRGDGAGVTNIHGGNIQTGTITAGSIAANTITGSQIAADAITSAHIAAGTITASDIAGRSLTADRIAVGALTSTEIAANTITADRLNIGALSAITANLGTVTAGAITGVSITGNTITGGTINGTTITGVSITGSSLVAGNGTIRLDTNGLAIDEGNGTGPARILLGGQSIFCESAKITMDGNFRAMSDINVDRDLIASRNITAGGYGSFSAGLYLAPPPAVASGTRALYFNFASNQICFWTGAADDAGDVQPWTGALAALAARVTSLEARS